MNHVNTLFLEALKASLNGTQVEWTADTITTEEFSQLFQQASVHSVLPMIFEAVYSCEAFSIVPPPLVMQIRRSVTQSITLQTMRTESFKRLFVHLREHGIRPCVVKGVICRGLYPNPDARISGDEDVLVPWDEYEKVHELLLDFGMQLQQEDLDRQSAYEVPYIQKKGALYIELHKQLFPPESEAYGNMNAFFTNVSDRLVETEVDGGKYLSMAPTDHMLYLICHSFKHFLHSGFGLRQVCDINLYAEHYGEEIDWDYVLESCQEIRADLFVASLFRIGEKYLVFDPVKADMTEEWRSLQVDESSMLKDLLDSGVFGQADMSRKHSSNITLNAVIAEKRGKKAKASIAGSIFLPLASMKTRFSYLERFPFLLPVAWVQRVLIYRKESGGKNSGNNAADSIRIGKERVELLKEYGIISLSKNDAD